MKSGHTRKMNWSGNQGEKVFLSSAKSSLLTVTKGFSGIVAITGNGKTTTTALTYHICKQGGADCRLLAISVIRLPGGGFSGSQAFVCGGDQSFSWMIHQTFRPDVAVLTQYHRRSFGPLRI